MHTKRAYWGGICHGRIFPEQILFVFSLRTDDLWG